MDIISTFSPTAETDARGVVLIAGPVHVLHRIDPSTYDAEDVGPMYRVRMPDGVEVDAFADELALAEPAPMTHTEFYRQS